MSSKRKQDSAGLQTQAVLAGAQGGRTQADTSHTLSKRFHQLVQLLGWIATGRIRKVWRSIRAAYRIRRSGLFNGGYYSATCPDAAGSDLGSLWHYLMIGGSQGFQPSPLFDTRFYLSTYPDVSCSMMDPLEHFVVYGAKERRNPSAWFNVSYYLDKYPDVAESGMNPLLHYSLFGWKEGRNPGPHFDTRFYLENNPDAKTSGLNPLEHYVSQGVKQGRQSAASPNLASSSNSENDTLDAPSWNATCRVCGTIARFDWFETVKDTNGVPTAIFICSNCTVLTNALPYQVDKEKLAKEQAPAVHDLYKIDTISISELRDNVAKHLGIVEHLLRQFDCNASTGVWLEIGAGSGYLSAAASGLFKKTYAMELDTIQIRHLFSSLELSNAKSVNRLEDIAERIEVLTMWHTVEHLINPLELLTAVKQRSVERCFFYFQVPLYRKQYIYRNHYWYFNARSVKAMARQLGFAHASISFDHTYDFMTCVYH